MRTTSLSDAFDTFNSARGVRQASAKIAIFSPQPGTIGCITCTKWDFGHSGRPQASQGHLFSTGTAAHFQVSRPKGAILRDQHPLHRSSPEDPRPPSSSSRHNGDPIWHHFLVDFLLGLSSASLTDVNHSLLIIDPIPAREFAMTVPPLRLHAHPPGRIYEAVVCTTSFSQAHVLTH